MMRSVLRGLPRARTLARPVLSRCMSTTTEKKEESMMDIVKEYGVVPFAGFASAIMISKEFFMVNEEIIVLGLFSGVIFYGYVTLYDDVSGALSDYAEGIKTQQVQYREEDIAYLDKLADVHREKLTMAAEIKEMYKTYEETKMKYVEAVNIANEQAVVDGLEEQLQDLYDAGQFVENYKNTKVLKMAKANLDAFVANIPQKEKDDFFKWSLGMLDGKSDADVEDFITAQFRKECEAASKKVVNVDKAANMEKIKKLAAEGVIDLDAPALKNARILASLE